MKGSLDDLDFTKISEKFDQCSLEESSLLSDSFDDVVVENDHWDHGDIHEDWILPSEE